MSKNNFRHQIISRNPSKSRDSLRHYLRSLKIESWQQFSKLIIPINSPLKCDHFSQNNFTRIVNSSPDTRVQIFRKSGVMLQNLFYQTSFDLSAGGACNFCFI